MIPMLRLVRGQAVVEPPTHVDVYRRPHILRDRPFDWFLDDDDMVDDLTPPHGVERVDVDGWLRSEIG